MTDSQSVGKPRPGRGTRSHTAEAKDARRQQLLDAARTQLLEQGYAKTSVASIVRAAGVAQGTFYLYFDSKEAAIRQLRVAVLHQLVGAFERAIARPDPAHLRLVRGVRALTRATKRHLALLQAFRQAASGEETEKVWIKGRERLTVPLGALVEAGVAEGVFDVEDPQLTAYLAITLFDDLIYEAIVFGKPAAARTTERHALRFLLRGLGTPPDRIELALAAPSRRG